ncbi:MmcQ/YjbR family DNA-binding protein [Edaphobacter aggregans]|uniref:MmcQ/YjbR family DNA-binding protein n=1 Tax=Edaphobacter aggregans TaxID=570835 RepID=UPI00068EA5AD|nr:MmcQ/YjbR family DNA-binding protein [Edaphobacter aggregans]
MPALAHKHDQHGELNRVRRICSALPATTERISHGEPTFFVGDKAFAIFANNHHHDGHVAVWVPAAPGIQLALVRASSAKFFRPPHVGVRGWIGIELDQVSDDELAFYLLGAWHQIAPPTLTAKVDTVMHHALVE